MTKAIRLLSRVLQLLQLRKGIALLAHVCLSMTKATRLLTRVLQLRQLQQLRQSVALLAHFRSIYDQSHAPSESSLAITAIAAIAAIAERYCTFSACLSLNDQSHSPSA